MLKTSNGWRQLTFMQNQNQEELLMALYKLVSDLSDKVLTLDKALEKALEKDYVEREWLTVTEAAKFAGVSFNTFKKIRTAGLKVTDIDGTKRVNKHELNSFLKQFSA